MPHIPFLSRLHIREYLALMLSFFLIALESFIALITLMLPTPIITLCYKATRRAFNYLSTPQGRRQRQKKKAVSSSIANASDFVELCELFGYYAEEHIVQTKDGYLLGLHRLAYRRGEEGLRVNYGADGDTVKKKVVYMHHGLMMNSEVWVCLTERERCLPFVLVERGYDVWLGNNRGNKYSKKSVHCAPTSTAFWNFSMDQFAFHDIPDSIDYILATTHQPSLSYIGFSQGTAQAFATLSIHPTLNEKVDVFIALAPAMSPKGLTSQIVDTFVKASPEVLFLAFGRRAILGSATMWQAILYPPIFVRLIDYSLTFLFGWTGVNITPHQKLAAYPHLYSFTSTKSVVHWFQIIRNGHFQMYDDEAPPSLALTNPNKYYKIAKFPTRNIKTPIVLVYGGSDSLVDINVMLHELPRHTVAKEIPHYEHLDFLWASTVNELVFPHVFDALEEYAAGDTSSPSGSITRKEKRREFRSPARFAFPERKQIGDVGDEEDEDESSSSPSAFRATKVSQNTSHQHLPTRVPETPSPAHGNRKTSITRALSGNSKRARTPSPARAAAAVTPSSAQPSASENSPPNYQDSPSGTQLTNQTSTSRPEGWWSSDEVAGSPKGSAASTRSPSRNSFESGRGVYGLKGIQIGASKAVGGLISDMGVGVGGGSRSRSGSVEDLGKKEETKKRRWKGRKKGEVVA